MQEIPRYTWNDVNGESLKMKNPLVYPRSLLREKKIAAEVSGDLHQVLRRRPGASWGPALVALFYS